MNFNRDIVSGLKNQLEQEGYANDEQDFGLEHVSFGAYAFEHMQAEIMADLRLLGFNKRLESGGRYFKDHGALYWIYDPDMIDYESAEDKSESWVTDAKSSIECE